MLLSVILMPRPHYLYFLCCPCCCLSWCLVGWVIWLIKKPLTIHRNGGVDEHQNYSRYRHLLGFFYYHFSCDLYRQSGTGRNDWCGGVVFLFLSLRSEERRVGKECRSWWWW